MRSKTSFSNIISKAVLKKDLLHFCPVWVIWLIVLIVMVPLNALSSTLAISERYGYAADRIPFERTRNLIWSCSSYEAGILFAVFGCLFGILLFYYLHFNKSANMIHAYPLTRETLFFSHFFAGLLMVIVPAIVAGLLLCGVSVWVEPRLIFPALYWMLWAVIAGLFFYSLSVVICMLTGVIFTVPVFFAIALYLVDGVRYLVYGFISTVNYGCGMMMNSVDINKIWTPLRYLTYEVNTTITMDEQRVFWEEGFTYYGKGALVVYAIVSVAFIALAAALYHRRRIEDVGKIVTVRPLRPVFQWGATFCTALLLTVLFTENMRLLPKQTFPVFLCFFLGFSVAIFYLLEVVMTRRWRSMNTRKWTEVAAFAVVCAVLGALCEADAFGLEKKLPNLADVIAVESSSSREVDAVEEVDIARILALHEELIAEKDVIEAALDGAENSQYITLHYYNKDGKRMLSRNYQVPVMDETRDLPSVAMLQAIWSDEEYFLNDQFCVNHQDMVLTGGWIDLYDPETFGDGDWNAFNFEFDEEDAKIIFDAYMMDFREGNLDNNLFTNNSIRYYYNDLKLNYFIPGERPLMQWDVLQSVINPEYPLDDLRYGTSYMGDSSAYLSISDRCTHTIEALKKLGAFEGGAELVFPPEEW